ncbi:MAG: TonB-dependent receptor plug domain-containing protein, partial [Halieaceae bacterium]|nr:TonB-dependent receptor plug domain-containing protein [Halieaceae bacterium]
MKTRVFMFIQILIAMTFMQIASASDSAPGAEARVEALQKELSDAKDKVAQLEAELATAQNTIAQMKEQSATVAATGAAQSAGAKDQTVRGEPLYDAYNPQTPVAQPDVIAEKLTPDSQRRPVAVTQLLKDDQDRGRIRDITRISDQVPNMQYGEAGNEAKLAIRGVRTNRTGAEADPVMAIYEDGVSVPTTTQALEPYVDVKMIEVLRGPQGVMYGRNAVGGVINIVSNEPDAGGWDAAFEGEYGYADGTRFDAMLNVPILETLSTRIAARYDLHSGFVGNFVLDGDA